jgi:6-phosphogluconolactonase
MTRKTALKFPFAFFLILTSICLLPSADGAVSPLDAAVTAKGTCLVYVGTYTGAKSKGIYAYRMDMASGAISSLGLVAETPNPTFLEIAPNNQFLYAVNEIDDFEGKAAGAVSAFSIDAATGKLSFLNQQSSGGRGPCHLALDREGKNVLVANYGGGSIESLPIQADGRLGTAAVFLQHSGKSIDAVRQTGPHAHCMTLDGANHFAFVCDLGLDKIMAYRFDASQGTLAANDPAFATTKPGAGPRHMIFGPDGRQAYVINELNSTIVRYAYDAARGRLAELQTVPLLPDDFKGTSTAAEIAVHPSGKFLYGSNRGDESIAVFAIEPASGKLTLVERVSTQGKTPRNFAIDPTGKFLFAANQNSGTVVVFNLDASTGKLEPSGKMLEAPSPVCVKFVPGKEPRLSQ